MRHNLSVVSEAEYSEIADAMLDMTGAEAALVSVASEFAAELTQLCLAVVQRGAQAAALEFPEAIGLALARAELNEERKLS